MQKKTKTLLSATAAALAVLSAVPLSGCMDMGIGGDSTSEITSVEVAQTSFTIEENAVNNMCNGAIKLTVTGMQRRPMSVFAGSSIEGARGEMDGSSESSVGAASAATDIAIQVDVSYTWNLSTYQQATGGGSVPLSLKDVLLPGSLMYVTGTDPDGNPYTTADIIVPAAQENVNALAINAQWDYDVLNSPLPETSVTKTGSFLLRVPSTVNNLSLVIMTPMGGQELSADAPNTGETYIYELPLT